MTTRPLDQALDRAADLAVQGSTRRDVAIYGEVAAVLREHAGHPPVDGMLRLCAGAPSLSDPFLGFRHLAIQASVQRDRVRNRDRLRAWPDVRGPGPRPTRIRERPIPREPNMTNRTLQEALARTVDLCERGYRTANPDFYRDIAKTLREHADAEGVPVLIRMSDGGPSLSSKRFAYPHIQDRASELLKGLEAPSTAI